MRWYKRQVLGWLASKCTCCLDITRWKQYSGGMIEFAVMYNHNVVCMFFIGTTNWQVLSWPVTNVNCSWGFITIHSEVVYTNSQRLRHYHRAFSFLGGQSRPLRSIPLLQVKLRFPRCQKKHFERKAKCFWRRNPQALPMYMRNCHCSQRGAKGPWLATGWSREEHRDNILKIKIYQTAWTASKCM